MFLLHCVTINLFFYIIFVKSSPDECFSRSTVPIPEDHLFSRLKKPLVIGHRGNRRIYQENTLDGFLSLLDDNVDGFELDIYLTKDKKLVVFHDDNTKFMTGEDHFIFNLAYKEIKKLNILKKFEYTIGKTRVWSFDKKRKIPLLKDVLEALKDSNLLMYLEMKPSHFKDMQLSADTGKEVAKLVTRMGLEKKCMLNSFDPFKTLAVKKENPNLIVGNFFSKSAFTNADQVKTTLKDNMPGMGDCSDSLPDGKEYTQYLLEHGTVLKAINGSFVDMWYHLYDNAIYTNDTFSKIKNNYGTCASFGGWTIYSMEESNEQWDTAEKQIQKLIDNGADRLITDNYPRLLKKLGRPIKRKMRTRFWPRA